MWRSVFRDAHWWGGFRPRPFGREPSAKTPSSSRVTTGGFLGRFNRGRAGEGRHTRNKEQKELAFLKNVMHILAYLLACFRFSYTYLWIIGSPRNSKMKLPGNNDGNMLGLAKTCNPGLSQRIRANPDNQNRKRNGCN